MHDYSRDPLVGALFGKHGIKQAIQLLFDNECYGSGLTLIFTGMDIMANLARPEHHEENRPDDFKAWVDRYINLEGETTVTPDEWWSARNATVHTYGAYSKAVRSGKARIICWVMGGRPDVRYDRSIHADLVTVNVLALKEQFFGGMNDFIVGMFADPQQRPLMEQRMKELLILIPFK